MKVLHLGYYNDIEDVNMLETDSVENIVSYMKMGFGHFNTINDLEDIELKDKDYDISYNGDFLVIRDINDDTNSFIDIYKINADEIVKTDIWWSNVDFELMEMVTGYNYEFFVNTLSCDDFVSVCDEYWRKLPYGERLKHYAEHY